MTNHMRLSVAASILALAFPAAGARAGTLTTLYSFSGGSDGGDPRAGVIYQGGLLYGATQVGGLNYCVHNPGCGVLFSVSPTTGTETLLHSFEGVTYADGSAPGVAPTYRSGVLYGPASNGGVDGLGTIYSYNISSGAYQTLYSFGAGGATDGSVPETPLNFQDGMFWGTTAYRGYVVSCGTLGCGTFYKFDPSSGAETVLYQFAGGTGDGKTPLGALDFVGSTMAGLFYGTTASGGAYNSGTLYSVATDTGAEAVLHNFGASSAVDGATPQPGLTTVSGVLYGVTYAGGLLSNGTIFKFDPSTGTETVLHSFAGGSDGANPTGELLYEGGIFYGTTNAGGGTGCANGLGCGTIFTFNPTTNSEAVVYSFSGAADGADPYAGLIYNSGVFYGTTTKNGGAGGTGSGTVFKFVP